MTRLQENLEKLKVQGSEDDSEEKVDSLFDQKFRNFQNEKEWYGNFPGTFSENFGNCWISKMRIIQRKIPEIPGTKSNGTEMTGKKFSKIWAYRARLSSFSEISREKTENGVPFTTENLQTFKSDFFLLNGKRPCFPGKSHSNSDRNLILGSTTPRGHAKVLRLIGFSFYRWKQINLSVNVPR